MTAVYDRHGIQVWQGDCLDVMRTLPDASVHALVTDPPSGTSFMSRAWDSDMGGRHSWVEWLAERMREAHRVLKPGGYGLVWAMPRTSHWTAWALEDAGFEIRDCVIHLFGSGFPKSLDVGKAIDKARGDNSDWRTVGVWLKIQRERSGYTRQTVAPLLPGHKNVDSAAANVSNWENGLSFPTWERWQQLRELIGFGDEMDAEVWRLNGRKGTPGEAWDLREITGQHANPDPRLQGWAEMQGHPRGTAKERRDIPATDAAKQWDGWGTALRPSQEMWWLVRKPMPGTVAQNVQEHGCGAINIGATRVGGRWPANAVFSHAATCTDTVCDESCPVADLDAQSGVTTSGNRRAGDHGLMDYMGADVVSMPAIQGDSGGASRFFPVFRWASKAPTSERPKVGGKAHPTVKSLDLMRWMVRLVCPPDGTVLDCFAGTGTTGHAARAEGMKAVLIEQDPDHIPLIVSRLDGYREPAPVADVVTGKAEPLDLLDLLDGDVA